MINQQQYRPISLLLFDWIALVWVLLLDAWEAFERLLYIGSWSFPSQHNLEKRSFLGSTGIYSKIITKDILNTYGYCFIK